MFGLAKISLFPHWLKYTVVTGSFMKIHCIMFSGDVQGILSISYNYSVNSILYFMDSIVKNGWKTDRALLCSEEWRAIWDFNGLSDKKVL